MSKPDFRITATRDPRNGWWAIESPDISNLFTQAPRVDQIDFMARDAISLLHQVDGSSFDLEIERL